MGFGRKMKRNAQKAQYKRFSRLWADERAYQRYVTETLEQTLPEGQPKLGRRPTFKMWCEMQERLARAKGSQPTQPVEPEAADLSWEEEEGKSEGA